MEKFFKSIFFSSSLLRTFKAKVFQVLPYTTSRNVVKIPSRWEIVNKVKFHWNIIFHLNFSSFSFFYSTCFHWEDLPIFSFDVMQRFYGVVNGWNFIRSTWAGEDFLGAFCIFCLIAENNNCSTLSWKVERVATKVFSCRSTQMLKDGLITNFLHEKPRSLS